jgi:D-inositol-3-phosphate glycosyltransferase
MSHPRVVAMDCSFLNRYGDLPSVFGFDVAVHGLTSALMTHGSFERLALFHQPGQAVPVSQWSEPKMEIEIAPATSIPAFLSSQPVFAWLQPDAETEPVKYRNAFGSHPFPFTTLIHNAGSPQLMRTFYLWLLLDGFAACDSMICTSRAVRSAVYETLGYMSAELERFCSAKLNYGGRLDVLPLGVDVNRFRPMSKTEIRRELGWPEQAWILLWFGRFSAVDKADLLPALRVFRRLVEANPGKCLKFVLAGSDHQYIPFVPSLVGFATSLGIAEHLLWIDHPPQQDRQKFFAAADVFTSPSDNLQETFGITPVEAMACGTPQVVSDWDGYRDTVVHGVTGFRVPTQWTSCDEDPSVAFGIGGRGYQGFVLAQSVAVDLREYQAALQQLIDHPELCQKMSAASRSRAEEVFGWSVVVRRYEELWEELNSIANKMKQGDLPRPPFARTQPCRRFQSYPTRVLGRGDIVVALSNDGRRLLAGEDPFPWHSPQEAAFFDPRAMLDLLAATAAKPGTFDEILQRFGHLDDSNRAVILRTLMWGMKHGLLVQEGS